MKMEAQEVQLSERVHSVHNGMYAGLKRQRFTCARKLLGTRRTGRVKKFESFTCTAKSKNDMDGHTYMEALVSASL